MTRARQQDLDERRIQVGLPGVVPAAAARGAGLHRLGGRAQLGQEGGLVVHEAEEGVRPLTEHLAQAGQHGLQPTSGKASRAGGGPAVGEEAGDTVGVPQRGHVLELVVVRPAGLEQQQQRLGRLAERRQPAAV
eukprot:scaffold16422_cov79-Isochrysis_galbana.AAC.1